MLKYSIPKGKETELREFPISDLYVSPDLDFVTGVTDYNIGIIDGEKIIIKSPYLIGSEVNTINSKNVIRQGKLGVRITLTVNSITKVLQFPILYDYKNRKRYILENNQKIYEDENVQFEGDVVSKEATQRYVTFNGDVSYFFNGSNGLSGYLVDHKFYEAEYDDETIDINAYLYIEDGKIVLDDVEFYADFSKVNEVPEIKRNIDDINNVISFIDEYSDSLSDDEKAFWKKQVLPIEPDMCLGLIDGNKCYVRGDSLNNIIIKEYRRKDWKRITKFKITKKENPTITPEDVMYGGYKNFVEYGGQNYYFSETYDEDSNYVGYGVYIDNVFYTPESNYGIKELYKKHHDLSYKNDLLYILSSDEYVNIQDTIVSFSDGGKFIILIDKERDNDIQVGNIILAESNYNVDINIPVKQEYIDEENIRYYVIYNGRRYDVEEHLFDTVTVSENEYRLIYDSEFELEDDDNPDVMKATAHAFIQGVSIPFIVTIKINNDEIKIKAHINNNIFYKDDNEVKFTSVRYGINEDAYDVLTSSGVTIGENVYEVREYLTESNEFSYYIVISDVFSSAFEVTEINGSSSYICYPVVNDSEVGEVEKDEIQRDICSIIVENKDAFTYRVKKDTFGNKIFTPENGLMESMSTEAPYVISDSYLLEKEMHVYRYFTHLSLTFPLVNGAMTNLMKDDIIKNSFSEYVKKNSINSIVDMEKDVYYPVWKDGDEFKPIRQLEFNLHFRTRDLNNWKVIEDDREIEFKNVETPNYKNSNWFVTDYTYYNDADLRRLHTSSDLLGLMNFTTSEVKNQALKLKKSFLRLSFYSTNNPQTQVLLGTSTIFLDEQRAFKKYMNLKNETTLTYKNVITNEITNEVSVATEINGDSYFTDELRLSSKIIVDDKNNTTNSSEGYYFYMFKEYAKKNREAIIYLKIDFNHAGIGKTIPMIIPRDTKSDDEGNLMLLSDSLNELKNGFNMRYIYKQIYLPIHIKYDEKSNKYVYYFGEKLRIQNIDGYDFIDDDVMSFNLFEVKFANESIIKK